MATNERARKKAKVCRNSSILEFFNKASGVGSTASLTTESATRTDNEHSEEVLTGEADGNSESMGDDNDDPEPSENDDEPSDQSSDDETLAVKTSKSTVTIRLEPYQPKKSKFPTMVGSVETFKAIGTVNGHGLNGLMKRSVPFVILVGWQQV